MAKSGTAHYVASGEQDASDRPRPAVLSAEQRLRRPAAVPGGGADGAIEDNLTEEDLELDTLIPDSPNQPYDMHEVITRILDDDEFLEVQAGYAQNIIIGFGRIEGRPVGIVANQPTQFAGCLDINASEKAARFVRTCDCFNIPIVDPVGWDVADCASARTPFVPRLGPAPSDPSVSTAPRSARIPRRGRPAIGARRTSTTGRLDVRRHLPGKSAPVCRTGECTRNRACERAAARRTWTARAPLGWHTATAHCNFSPATPPRVVQRRRELYRVCWRIFRTHQSLASPS